MRITRTSVLVDDQATAHDFYTGILGFVVRHDLPLGEHRWLTSRSRRWSWARSSRPSSTTPAATSCSSCPTPRPPADGRPTAGGRPFVTSVTSGRLPH